MPPNKIGGKNYKKGKHTEDAPILYEKLEGQMYGRILKLLGGCNALVYCNDNRERLCHIRGNMRKKVWLTPGDIVLISTRDLAGQGANNVERGDICAKYDPRVIEKLRHKDRTINDRLFINIEKSEGTGHNIPAEDENGFIFESEENILVDGNDSEEATEMKPSNRAAQKRNMMRVDEDDINIDDI
jgi:translation initiation factor 1A